ncbi:hypothetical protein C8R42DRAFT_726122 [Lentinula raphanica]|nr:hypothetical protein C8R42DRAFT_726122 [Lentinula raphanica]
MAENWFPIREPADIHVTGQEERELIRNSADEGLDPESVELFIDGLVEWRNEIRTRLAQDCAPYEAAYLNQLCLNHARCHPHEPLTADKLQGLHLLARRQAERSVYQVCRQRVAEQSQTEACLRRAELRRMERKQLREKNKAAMREEEMEEEASLL